MCPHQTLAERRTFCQAFAAGCGTPRSPGAGASPAISSYPGLQTSALPLGPTGGPGSPGHWTHLPGYDNQNQPLSTFQLVLGQAGAFLGLTGGKSAPRVYHGAWEGEELRWGPAWKVPAPIGSNGARRDWADFTAEVDEIRIAIDKLDPKRIAVTRIEYQGGSYGVVVRRWGEAFDEVASPTDTDIRFGQPAILRGDNLWSHDCGTMWQMRGRGGKWTGHSIEMYDRLLKAREGGRGDHELGWAGDISPDGKTLFLDVYTGLEVFVATPGGAFQWSHSVTLPGVCAETAVWAAGGPVVLLRNDKGNDYRVTLFDGEVRNARTITLPTGYGIKGCQAIEGRRMLLLGGDAMWIFDLVLERMTHRLDLPTSLKSIGAHGALCGDRVVLASHDLIGVYRLHG